MKRREENLNRKGQALLHRGSEGQALVEAVVSIGVIVVGVMGALAFLSSSLGYNLLVTNQYTATYLAVEQLEVVKNIIDINGLDTVGSGNYYVDYDSVSLIPITNWRTVNQKDDFFTGESGGKTTPFKKKLSIEEIVPNQVLRVRSFVEWDERGETYTVEMEDHFYEWRG